MYIYIYIYLYICIYSYYIYVIIYIYIYMYIYIYIVCIHMSSGFHELLVPHEMVVSAIFTVYNVHTLGLLFTP